jgi:hypothetical protein
MTFGTILRINKKGGDVHGKIPMRIGTTGSFCQTHRARFFAPLGMTIGPRGVRRGEENSAWPGQKLLRGAEIPRFTRNKLRNLGTGSLI